ncbi:MAG TPA: hypothetical protein VGB24_19345 [Longimicrobium sp.]|jgi:hypothetical protein|uniref:hypothetical protein n=1 Tax=Longimicrobium sp. TaxID=2029185 RepID=UPI002EDAD4DE
MSRTRIISAIALVISVAACGDAGGNPVAPDGPSFDSGPILGGNRTGSDSTTTTTTSSTTTTEPDSTGYSGPILGGN